MISFQTKKAFGEWLGQQYKRMLPTFSMVHTVVKAVHCSEVNRKVSVSIITNRGDVRFDIICEEQHVVCMSAAQEIKGSCTEVLEYLETHVIIVDQQYDIIDGTSHHINLWNRLKVIGIEVQFTEDSFSIYADEDHLFGYSYTDLFVVTEKGFVLKTHCIVKDEDDHFKFEEIHTAIETETDMIMLIGQLHIKKACCNEMLFRAGEYVTRTFENAFIKRNISSVGVREEWRVEIDRSGNPEDDVVILRALHFESLEGFDSLSLLDENQLKDHVRLISVPSSKTFDEAFEEVRSFIDNEARISKKRKRFSTRLGK